MADWINLKFLAEQLAARKIVDPNVAGDELAEAALVSGKIRTRGYFVLQRAEDDPPHHLTDVAYESSTLGPEWYTSGAPLDIPAPLWAEATVDFDKRDIWSIKETYYRFEDGKQFYFAYEVQALGEDARAFMRKWDEARLVGNEDKVLPPTEPRSRHKGGAPLKHDWASLAGHMVFYIIENDLPDQQVVLSEEAERFFEERGRAPDKRDIERFVSVLWDDYEKLRKKKQGSLPGQ